MAVSIVYPPNQVNIRYLIQIEADVNLEGSVRSRARRGRGHGGERDLIEAGLNEAAGGWALWG